MSEPRPLARPIDRSLRSAARRGRRLARAAERDVGRPRGRVVIRLWLPLTPLFLLLAPFALIAAPLALAAVRPARGAPPLRTALALGAALMALSGTVVSVESPRARVRIRVL